MEVPRGPAASRWRWGTAPGSLNSTNAANRP